MGRRVVVRPQVRFLVGYLQGACRTGEQAELFETAFGKGRTECVRYSALVSLAEFFEQGEAEFDPVAAAYCRGCAAKLNGSDDEPVTKGWVDRVHWRD